MTDIELRKKILGLAHLSGNSFIYYDRKEDKELEIGKIEAAINSGVVTFEYISREFIGGIVFGGDLMKIDKDFLLYIMNNESTNER